MATAEQIKALINSHFTADFERFCTAALQVAAHEALLGHGGLANDIRIAIDKARSEQKAKSPRFASDVRGLVLSAKPDTPKSALVVPPEVHKRIDRIIREYRQREVLRRHGLAPRRKLMLVGPPGTGKTMTARILSHELSMDLHTVQVDKMVTKFMGESASKLRMIFDMILLDVGVYFFDEFDAIGGERSMDNDVGEMRRVLNAFLQFIEQDSSDSLIVAATNSPQLLDRALFRRFDDVLHFGLPESRDRRQLFENCLNRFLPREFPWSAVVASGRGLSHADITQACRDAMKATILSDQEVVNPQMLLQMLRERRGLR